MDPFGVMTNIFPFLLSLFTSPGSGDHSSQCCLCSLTRIFTTSLFLGEKHNTNLLPSSHTNPSSRGASTLCQINPNHHNSPPWLFPSSPRLSGRLLAGQHSHKKQRSKKKGNHLPDPWQRGGWYPPWVPRAGHCWNFGSSGRVSALWEAPQPPGKLLSSPGRASAPRGQAPPQQFAVHPLQHTAGWRGSSSGSISRSPGLASG